MKMNSNQSDKKWIKFMKPFVNSLILRNYDVFLFFMFIMLKKNIKKNYL